MLSNHKPSPNIRIMTSHDSIVYDVAPLHIGIFTCSEYSARKVATVQSSYVNDIDCIFIPKQCVSTWLSISVEHAFKWIFSCFLEVFSINLLYPVLIWNTSDVTRQLHTFSTTDTLFMRCFMSLCTSHKGLPRWSYVITVVSLFLIELLLLVKFSDDVIWLPFDGYWINRVDCRWSCQDAFCTPLMITATSRFCSGLTLFVVTEAVVLVVSFFLLCHSFNACSLAGSFSIRWWLSYLSCNHSSLPYHLVGSLI